MNYFIIFKNHFNICSYNLYDFLGLIAPNTNTLFNTSINLFIDYFIENSFEYDNGDKEKLCYLKLLLNKIALLKYLENIKKES